MRKLCVILSMALLLSSFLLSACNSKPDSTIKYERKLGKYFETEQKGKTSRKFRDVLLEIPRRINKIPRRLVEISRRII